MKDPIEEALERLRPSELPNDLMARLTAARPQPAERRSFWLRWMLPLAAGATAAILATMWLRQESSVQPSAPTLASARIPVERNDFLVNAQDIGVVVGPNQQPYRIMQFDWLEQDTIRPTATGPAIRVETKRRNVIPIALEIY